MLVQTVGGTAEQDRDPRVGKGGGDGEIQDGWFAEASPAAVEARDARGEGRWRAMMGDDGRYGGWPRLMGVQEHIATTQ